MTLYYQNINCIDPLPNNFLSPYLADYLIVNYIFFILQGEWSKVAPVRILSFDIECAGRKGVFPEPEKDPVIQIANMVINQGDKDPFIRNVFTLNSCAPIVGSHVFSYTHEGNMLKVCRHS